MKSVSKSQALLALFALSAFSSAHAITQCVSTVPALQSALLLGQFDASSPLQIKIVQGTYVINANMIYQLAPPTSIEGGYTAGCVARTVNASNTILNIGSGHAFDLRQKVASPYAEIKVSGLTFSNTFLSPFFSVGQLGDFSNDEGRVSLSHVRFTGVGSPNLQAFNGQIAMENVLIDHINSGGTACAVYIYSSGGADVRINHLTADFVGGHNFCIDDDNDDSASVIISNSILWSSGGGQSFFKVSPSTSTNVALLNDLFIAAQVSGTSNIQNQINAAPGWIDAANGNYKLVAAPLSPAINSGSLTPPGGEPSTDIEGKTRLIGSAPDRGAYESLVTDQTVFTVTNTLDNGSGSLREAITLASQSITPPKSIVFNIPGPCPAVIALSSVLPNINSRMSIDGYTQPGSVKNSSSSDFDAVLCVLLKPAAGSLAAGFTVPANSFGSLTLRGMGLGGFGQPVRLLGGQGNVVAGNQFGGSQSGVALPSAGLSAISVGSSASGVLIGGISASERNYISGAGSNGVDNNATATAAGSCQIVNNLIFGNNFGINNSGDGCDIVGNRVYGNSITNIWLNGGNNNIVTRNLVGLNPVDQGVAGNTANGILITGSGNIIGASGQGGSISANTVRFNNAGGIIVKGDSAINNSINANIVYGNGAANNAMDIDLAPTGFTGGVGITAPTANDVGDLDTGPNQLQNFPVGASLVYTGAGTGAAMLDRPATVSVVLDSQAGKHRVDAYYSPSANPIGQFGVTPRGHGEVYLGHISVFAFFAAPLTFTMPVSIPTQLATGVISFTATDSTGNTSEIGTGLSIVAPPVVVDAMFKNGFE